VDDTLSSERESHGRTALASSTHAGSRVHLRAAAEQSSVDAGTLVDTDRESRTGTTALSFDRPAESMYAARARRLCCSTGKRRTFISPFVVDDDADESFDGNLRRCR
jgi:hypothetical protein